MGTEESLPGSGDSGEQKGGAGHSGVATRGRQGGSSVCLESCWRVGEPLGDNKEVFNAEVYAIPQALEILDRREERGRRYTDFVDSTSAIDRVRADGIGPGRAFAVAAIERCSRIMAGGWSHHPLGSGPP